MLSADGFFECGEGSGEACSNNDPAYCVDDDQLGYCQYNKDTWESCQLFCETVGIDGQTYEYGECDASIPDDIACFCCDSGDEGCVCRAGRTWAGPPRARLSAR